MASVKRVVLPPTCVSPVPVGKRGALHTFPGLRRYPQSTVACTMPMTLFRPPFSGDGRHPTPHPSHLPPQVFISPVQVPGIRREEAEHEPGHREGRWSVSLGWTVAAGLHLRRADRTPGSPLSRGTCPQLPRVCAQGLQGCERRAGEAGCRGGQRGLERSRTAGRRDASSERSPRALCGLGPAAVLTWVWLTPVPVAERLLFHCPRAKSWASEAAGPAGVRGEADAYAEPAC